MSLLRSLILAFLLLPFPVSACLWDDDTLAEEARGLPDFVDIVTGRFDVYPPEYYTARLSRVVAELENDPAELRNYDNAAVACGRLGMYDEAIEWMRRKRGAMESNVYTQDEVTEHKYRYYANLGTFFAHRWISNGGDREDLEDLRTARDLIAAAIDINPDAHFGRERYQLHALEWIIAMPRERQYGFRPTILDSAPGFKVDSTRPGHEGFLSQMGYADAIEGISGLVVLGAGQQSVDAMNTLAVLVLQEGHSSLAYLAALRVQELLREGGRSIHSDYFEHDSETYYQRQYMPGYAFLENRSLVMDYFEAARPAAEEWRAARNDYIRAMIARGEHPDTHPEIWAAAPNHPPAPPFPQQPVFASLDMLIHQASIGIVLLAVLLAAIILFLRRFLFRK